MLETAVLLVSPSAAQTSSHRITQTSGEMMTMAGTVHPLTKRATDLGELNSQSQLQSLTLNISLSAAQQTELNALLEAQQNPKSPQYHQWLTQEAYGARFGLDDADLSAVTAWLTSQGFTVGKVSKSRNAIHFSGKVWQVESAFHTQLHRFQMEGREHFGNTTDIQLPAWLGSVVGNVRGLNNFRPKPQIHKRAVPNYTVDTTDGLENFLTPADWATIYDVNAIYAAGYTGTGAHVGVVGQTYAPLSDIANFRSASGLTAPLVTYECIDPVPANCKGASAISTAGDLGEADLDIEWAGGIAKNATVDFVYAPYSDVCANLACTVGFVDPVTQQQYDVFDALQHAVQNYTVAATGEVLPVISMSYGDCEESFVNQASYVAWVTMIGQQANSQGQTIVVASGDSGAFECEASTDYPASFGVSVDVPADSPYYTAVGGTTLSGDESKPATYWNQTPDLVNSALSYIPETVWNDTAADAALVPPQLSASGGGVSLYYSQPSWQPTPSNFTGTAKRFVPDVAFAASADHDGYMLCSPENNSITTNECTNGFLDSQGSFGVAGGTSAPTPSFAGMLTLLVQKYGSLGNINPTLYGLATTAANYSTIFHATESNASSVNNSDVPCVVAASDTGCPAGASFGYSVVSSYPYYNMVTGLGSVDGGQLFKVLTPAYTITPSPTSISLSPGSSQGVTVTFGAGTSNTVTWTATTSSPSITVSPASGTQTLPGNGSVTLQIAASTSATNRAPALPWTAALMAFGVVLASVPLARRRKRVAAVLLTALGLSALGFMMSCGGGSSSAAPGARSYTVTVRGSGNINAVINVTVQ
jgi:subtilase family serine protease